MPSLGEEAEKTLCWGEALGVKGLTLLGSRTGGSRDPWSAPHLVFFCHFKNSFPFPSAWFLSCTRRHIPCPVLVGLSTLGMQDRHLLNPG